MNKLKRGDLVKRPKAIKDLLKDIGINYIYDVGIIVEVLIKYHLNENQYNVYWLREKRIGEEYFYGEIELLQKNQTIWEGV